METKEKVRHRKTESGRRLTEFMAQSYLRLHERAAAGDFVVWIAIIVPAEIFAGFDGVVFAVPESHAAMSAAKGVGPLQCEKAEKLGYSMDLCSYARIDIGTHFDGEKDSPTFGLPKPHLLISNNNNCSLLVKWFDVFHRAWNVPHLVLDVPFAYHPQTENEVGYIVAQFQKIISTIKEMTGKRFDIEKVREAISYSREAYRWWKDFLLCATNRPSGITAFDSFVQMAPILTDRGRKQLVEHYRLLVEETKAMMQRGEFPVPSERYRLLWDNIAPWHQLKNMSARLAALHANIIAASYTYCIGTVEGEIDLFDGETEDPLRYLARMQNFSVCPMGKELRKRAMSKAVETFGIDGVIFASNRSCKVYSVMQMDLMSEISAMHGIPCTMIDVDHADIRKYSEEHAFLRIEALLEQIERVKRGKSA
ncbi:MAG: 2-hydroxyacyl-CoA dehydratase family protein [Spirochaetes bacterium]|nr:2-hydroxyacyl-CoA dehydratase family protein [Spirochaetota bacterium]